MRLAEGPSGKGGSMKEYDVIVIGSGSGLSIVHKALAEKARVALVAREYLGGTCLNVGCVPSKLLIGPADRIMEIAGAARLGIAAPVKSVDFRGIMERMRAYIQRGVSFLREDLTSTENLDFYEASPTTPCGCKVRRSTSRSREAKYS